MVQQTFRNVLIDFQRLHRHLSANFELFFPIIKVPAPLILYDSSVANAASVNGYRLDSKFPDVTEQWFCKKA